jgi:hypothetical protein
MKAKKPHENETRRQTQGNPQRLVLLKTAGAFPAIASAYRAREEVYMLLEAADHAEESKAALMILFQIQNMLDQLLKHDAHIDRCRLTKAKI